MKLSIITVNYNDAVSLCSTIKSVVEQKTNAFEYLVIDGGSTDNSVDIIRENSTSIDYWISEKDNGIYDAMNKGIAKATGDYLMFLNSGDLLANNEVLAVCIEDLANIKGIDIFYGNILVANHEDPTYNKHIYPNTIDIRFFKNDTINHQAALISSQLFREFGFYPTNYKLASDYWLFLQSCLQQKKFRHINHILVIYDFSGASSQDNYSHYRREKKIIWDLLVPTIINDLVSENEKLINEIQKLQRMLSYKIITIASKINSVYQRFKGKS